MEPINRTAHIRVLAEGDKEKQQLLNSALTELVDETEEEESKEVLSKLISLVKAKDFSESFIKIEETINSMLLISSNSSTRATEMSKTIMLYDPFTSQVHANLIFSYESSEYFPGSSKIQIIFKNDYFFIEEAQESNVVSIYKPKFKVMPDHIYLIGNTFLYFKILNPGKLSISYKSHNSKASNKIKTKQDLSFGLNEYNNFFIIENDSDIMRAIGDINYISGYWEISLRNQSHILSRCLHTQSTLPASNSYPLKLSQDSELIINKIFLKVSII